MARYIFGIGCDRGASLQTLTEVVNQGLNRLRITADQVITLASIDKKSDEVGLLELSKQQGWPVQFFTAAQLAQVEVPNPSAVVLKYMGTPAVSEAAAILAGKATQESLVLEKLKYCGSDTKNATLSVVKVEDE